MKFSKSLLINTSILCGLICIALYAIQDRMIYPAHIANERYENHTIKLMNANDPLRVKKVKIGEGFGYLMSPDVHYGKKLPALIYFHGNADLAKGYALYSYEFDALLEYEFYVLVVEYPTYDKAGGALNYQAIIDNAIASYDSLIQNDFIDEDKIFVYGRSIGGASAAILAQKRDIKGLVLESTFTSLSDLAYDKFLPGFLVKYKFDNLNAVKSFTKPLLIMHGTDDEVVPFSHANRLKEANPNATFVSNLCGHNNCKSFIDYATAFIVNTERAMDK